MNTDLVRSSNLKIAANSKLKHASITEAIIGAFYDVYNELGHGFLESVYRDALTLLLKSKGISVDREKTVQVSFRGTVIGVFRADLVVQDAVSWNSSARGQSITYMKRSY
jgi:GxxExxY protein